MKEADRDLDERTVGRVVAAQFPSLSGRCVRRLGEGWDNEVFLVGSGAEATVFRFPKRAERLPWQEREIQIVAFVAGEFGSLVPDFRYRGEASADFPYPFVGYPLLPGTPARHLDRFPPTAAAGVGEVFAQLHGMDPHGALRSDVVRTPSGWEDGPFDPIAEEERDRIGPLVERLLGTEWRVRTDRYAVPAGNRLTVAPADRRLVHGDVCDEHLLFENGALSGIIDWTDALIGDPALDFAGLITLGGWDLVRIARNAYHRTVDPGFDGRLVEIVRRLTLHWLVEADADGLVRPERHLEWIRRAFAD